METLDAMKTAVRVLTALNERRDPDPADVAELRRLASARPGVGLDEVACDVIQRSIGRRPKKRALGASG